MSARSKPTVAVAALATLAFAAPAQAQAPDEDPFYAPAKRALKGKHGTLIRHRKVDLSASNLPVAHRAWQLLYRSRDSNGRRRSAVATLIVPDAPAATQRRPLLAYQPAEDSLTRRCASSYELRTGSGGDPDAFGMALQLGWAVVVPDFEGPHSEWTAGKQEGHAVLDSIRASQRFRRAKLRRRGRVTMWGYSGGGHATAFASEIQRRYAPRINLVGVAHGGAVSDTMMTAENLDGGPFSGILLAAGIGIARGYPEMRLGPLLNDAGREMRRDIGSMCLEEFTPAYPLRNLSDFTKVADPLAVPRVARVLRKVGLGHRAPRVPLYIYHAILDELNPIAASDALVEKYCSKGATVSYSRELLGEHVGVAVLAAPAAFDFLEARVAGEPPTRQLLMAAQATGFAPRKERVYANKSPSERHDGRRERLVEAGLDLFGNRGYTDVAITELCAKANVSTRSFYEHFNTREEVLVTLHDEVNAAAMTAVVEAISAVDPGDLPARARAGVAAYMDTMTSDRRKARIALIESVGVSQDAEQHRQDAIGRFAGLLELEANRFADEGVVPKRDFHLLAVALVGAVNGLINTWTVDPDWDAHVDDVVSVAAEHDRRGDLG